MKKILVMLSLVCVATFGFAQGQRQQRPEPPSAKEMIAKATKELSLTDQQVTQWEEIHEKYESSIGDRSKAKAIREKMSKELEATLSEEQLVKFKKMKKNQGPPPRKN